ncbi:MAG: hypothetical protein ACJ79J_02100 [Gemmatimonadaceae bacterium]
MTYDLTRFDLGDMLKCSLRLREAASGLPSLEASAQRVCKFLYDELEGPGVQRACALVRCYKTHAFGSLAPDLQRFALGVLGTSPSRADIKCLTLMATVGSTGSWNSRYLSRGHRAIPLPSPEIVEKAPMIAQLIKDLGLDISQVIDPSPDIVKELAGKRHGVFHVEHALGSPYIPAQEEFVVRHGVKSVLGFGGMLATGDLFAVILFATVQVPASTAERFRSLALDVKSAFSRFTDATVFSRTSLTPDSEARAQ